MAREIYDLKNEIPPLDPPYPLVISCMPLLWKLKYLFECDRLINSLLTTTTTTPKLYDVTIIETRHEKHKFSHQKAIKYYVK